MDSTAILLALLQYILPPVIVCMIGYTVWIHTKVSGLITSMAVNESKDNEVIKSLDKWDARWIVLENQLKEIYDRLPTKK